MRVCSLRLRQRLVSLAVHFLVASNRPALTSPDFFNVDCSRADIRLSLMLTGFHCHKSVVSSISATRLATNTFLLRLLRTVYLLQNCSWPWPKTAHIHLHFVLLDYLFFQLPCHDCCMSFDLFVTRCLSGATLLFLIANAKSADYSFGCERR